MGDLNKKRCATRVHRLWKPIVMILSLSILQIQNVHAGSRDEKNIASFKHIFSEVSEKLDASQMDRYYTQDFILESNGEQYNYQVYKKQQVEIFKTLKKLRVIRYENLFSSKNYVAGRMVILLQKKDKTQFKFYVIILAQIKNNKVHRIWEMTSPRWDDKLPNGKSS